MFLIQMHIHSDYSGLSALHHLIFAAEWRASRRSVLWWKRSTFLLSPNLLFIIRFQISLGSGSQSSSLFPEVHVQRSWAKKEVMKQPKCLFRGCVQPQGEFIFWQILQVEVESGRRKDGRSLKNNKTTVKTQQNACFPDTAKQFGHQC